MGREIECDFIVVGVDIRVMVFFLGQCSNSIDERDSIHEGGKFKLSADAFDIRVRMPLRHLRDVFLHIFWTERLCAAFTRNAFLFEKAFRHTGHYTLNMLARPFLGAVFSRLWGAGKGAPKKKTPTPLN